MGGAGGSNHLIQGLAGHEQEFGFYSKHARKPLKEELQTKIMSSISYISHYLSKSFLHPEPKLVTTAIKHKTALSQPCVEGRRQE